MAKRIDWPGLSRHYITWADNPSANGYQATALRKYAGKIERLLAQRQAGRRVAMLDTRTRSWAEKLISEIQAAQQSDAHLQKDAEGNLMIGEDVLPWQPPALIDGLWPKLLLNLHAQSPALREQATHLAQGVVRDDTLREVLDYYIERDIVPDVVELDRLMGGKGSLHRAYESGVPSAQALDKLVHHIPGVWQIVRVGKWTNRQTAWGQVYDSRSVTLHCYGQQLMFLSSSSRLGDLYDYVYIKRCMISSVASPGTRYVIARRSYPCLTRIRKVQLAAIHCVPAGVRYGAV